MGNKNKVLLKDICNVITKGTTPSQFSEKGINFIRIENINGLNIDSNFDMFISEKIHNTDLKRSILKKNDILFAIAGATVGKCAIVNEDCLPANTNQALAIIRLKNNYDSFYIANILASEKMKKYIYLNISVGAQPNLSLEQIGNFQFYVDDIAIQTKIATFLNLYYKKIELQKKKVGLLYNLFRCALAFEFHKITDYVSLGSIANLYQPQTITQADFIDNAQYKVFGANGYIGFYDKYNHNKEQVVISCRGEKSSQVNMVEPYSWITGNSMVINLDNSHINKSYVYFALKSQNLKYLITGSGQPQIVRSDLLKHKIPFTNTKTQNDIVSKLSNINNKIFLEQQKLELLEKYKQGLLQKMFI